MILPPGTGAPHVVLGTTATIKLSAADTSGRLGVVEHEVPRDAGPPPHVHRREDELLYILDGTFAVVLGDAARPRAAGRGTLIHVPVGTVHTTRCTSDRGRLLSVYSPGGGEAFFREAGTIDQTDIEAVRALADRHGMTVAS